MTVAGSYLADQVLALAEPAVTTANLAVVLPIPAPGWVQRIATPTWPADLAAHMSPSAVTNQCVAGSLATWALMHTGDPRFSNELLLVRVCSEMRRSLWSRVCRHFSEGSVAPP
jgi:hypothetical protein